MFIDGSPLREIDWSLILIDLTFGENFKSPQDIEILTVNVGTGSFQYRISWAAEIEACTNPLILSFVLK